MSNQLPAQVKEFMDWPWSRIEPFVTELLNHPVDASSVSEWLAGWTHLDELLQERYARLYVATTVDTTDDAAQQRFVEFLDQIYPQALAAEQKLKEKLLGSGVEPEDFAIPLRNLKAEADLFRQENLPLLSEEEKLVTEHDKIIGVQTVEWEGKEVTLLQLQTVQLDVDRTKRERAWRLGMERQLQDRQEVNELWKKFMQIRLGLAENAGRPDYRAYRWQQLLRFDYTPDDCASFHRAIEEVVVPAAERASARRSQRLGLDTLRPWDMEVDPMGQEPLRPFQEVAELEEKTAAIFCKVDPQLGEHFETMRRGGLLDLGNRKGKSPSGYCIDFAVERRPFIFMNAVGIHDDVQTLLHEGGHAFHVFETGHITYSQQKTVPMEFAEVASMSMELLASPYLEARQGGFYSERDAARARIEHLEHNLRFWPYMAVVDAFQHWVYTNPQAAMDGANCDSVWADLWRRFMRFVDWSGLEDEMATGWQRKLHIHQSPFYYVEYGLAQLGATLIWRNALQDQAGAVAAYRHALSLGGTVTLPELFVAAGAKFAFDAGTLGQAVELIETTVARLEPLAYGV
jgi:oligoendopeptidase F